MTRSPRALALVAAAAALASVAVFAVWAAGSASDARALRAELERSERSRLAADGATALVRATRRVFDELGRFGAEVSTAWLHGSETPGSRRAKDVTNAWERVKAVLLGPTAPRGVVVAIYEETAEGSAEPMKLLGWADAAHVVQDGLEAWKGRLPAGLLRRESEDRAVADLPDLLWFSSEGAQPVRVHQHSLYAHEYDDAGEAVAVTRGVDVSIPFEAPPGLAVEVRCDFVDGALDRALGAHAIVGRTPSGDDVVAPALDPADSPWRWPVGGTTPRATVRAAAPSVALGTQVPSPIWLPVAGALGVLALAAGAWSVTSARRRGRAVAPDVSGEAAHEMKTPLTAMRGAIEVALRRERTPAEYRESLVAALEEVKGLQNVVSSVLLLTRGAETPPAKEPVEMTEVVRAEAERVHKGNADREVSLASVKPPRVVTGDPSLLARAVANLLDNAALHSVAGGAIRVRVEAVDGELIVSVEDDGPGIPASRREKVFERFWRGPEVGARGIPGSGLGLPISRWIAELHGGSLTLDPAVVDRARFVLRLPIARA